MSIVIPPLQAADVPMYEEKFYITNYSKTTGIVQSTWYTMFENTDCEVDRVVWIHNNNENDDKQIDFKATIDGEEIPYDSGAVGTRTEGANWYMFINNPATVGTNADLANTASNAPTVFGHTYIRAAAEDGKIKAFRCQSIKIEYMFDDAPGTNQDFLADIYFTKKEAT